MKLRLLMIFGLLTSLFVSAQAQTKSNEVVFVDADGKVLANNTTLVLSKIEDAKFPPGMKEIASKLFILNKSGEELTVTLDCTVSGLNGGDVQVCALDECNSYDEDGTYEVVSQVLSAASDKKEISIERSFENDEKCTITLKITTKKKGSDVEKEGPTVTIKFDADATGIASAALQSGSTYDVFNVHGVLLHKQVLSLPTLSKGIYIVRQKDSKGLVSTLKYVVR
ncbi:MAG: T9SS C-terminal target domain-containing protein [Prevotella fusca]|uniref:T9SS C-terminal target domain-containing protein n=1 Tax=Prevotella fusca TaxID=589436 RepID=UPI003FA071EE